MDPEWATQWRIFDLDWNGDRINWSQTTPMDCDLDMINQIETIHNYGNNPFDTITFVYRNGIKALPWFSVVREKLEDPNYWGFFMPYKQCKNTNGYPDGRCGPNATQNLYHDFEQTTAGDCGLGVECGEYVFNHMNTSLISWLTTVYFGGVTGTSNPLVRGFYVDDGWSSNGPSEMDSNATQLMGMNSTDIENMVQAWNNNVNTWSQYLVSQSVYLYNWMYGNLLAAPGWSWSNPQSTCQSFMQTNCGANAPTQSMNNTLVFSFSRPSFPHSWPLAWPEQDIAAFLLVRGPYAYIGYGWWQCATVPNPFERPVLLDGDFGLPMNYCSESSNGVWQREYSNANITLDCNTFNATYVWK